MKYIPPLDTIDENASFIDGSPEHGIEGSVAPAEAIEHPQREIVEVITQAGLTPSGEDLGQLWKALLKIIKVKVPLATLETPGLVQPDGVTTYITSEGGLLAASPDMPWRPLENYRDPCLRVGSDGKLYLWKKASGPGVAGVGAKDPTVAGGDVYWEDYKKGDGLLSGGIVAFSGTFGGPNNRHPIPRGETKPELSYILCDGGSDGKGGTVPDLCGRMLLGADENHPTGSTGGALTHNHSITGTVGETTLTVAQIASHNHPMPRNNPAQVNGRCYYPSVDSAAYTTTTDASGGSGSHTHGLTASSVTASSLPPYYALSYVIRIT